MLNLAYGTGFRNEQPTFPVYNVVKGLIIGVEEKTTQGRYIFVHNRKYMLH